MNNDVKFYSKWARFALFNFVVLAAVGVLLRYKILFPLPLVDQKHLLHGHSHFAFAGWVSLALYVAVIYILQPSAKVLKQLEWLLVAQQMSSYGMLFTFPFTGYAAGSIAFSTISISIGYAFAWLVIKEILQRRQPKPENKWLMTGMLCNVVSSLGTFVLAYLMMTKNLSQDWYFGSVYFFLHFQYNGFFLFTIGALFIRSVSKHISAADTLHLNRFFYLLIIALIPAWFLSLMWMRIPGWMYATAATGGLIQLVALFYFVKAIIALKSFFQAELQKHVKWFWLAAALALVIKIVLQALSAVPQLNTYAFGVRPIVIGFLHLVLLVFVSVFIMGYLLQQQLLQVTSPVSKKAGWVFLIAVLSNEVLLMLQGIAGITFHTLPYVNHLLLLTAIFIFSALLTLFIKNSCKIKQAV
ncbi:MAG: hypothetical protein HEQ40_07255 [Lacibacter sp.]|jgi:hypothetical protein